MSGLIGLGLPALAVVFTALGWAVLRSPVASEPSPVVVRSLLAAAKRRALLAVAAVAASTVALVFAAASLPSLVGLPVALVPALGGAVGLLSYAATPPRAATLEPGVHREASLVRRTPLSFLPPRGALAVAALVALQMACLGFTGATSSVDEQGRYRLIGFQVAERSSAAGPYAGWFYAVPLLVVTGVLVGATFLALRRVSTTPALPQREFADADAGWRRSTSRIILAISTAALLVQFAGVATFSGGAMLSAAFDGVAVGWKIAGIGLLAGGLVMLVGAVVVMTLAVLWACTLPVRSWRPARTPPVSADEGGRAGPVRL
ncbi:MAG: hypothetical protein ACK5PP_10320 [Acidimicrobiales bacterium]